MKLNNHPAIGLIQSPTMTTLADLLPTNQSELNNRVLTRYALVDALFECYEVRQHVQVLRLGDKRDLSSLLEEFHTVEYLRALQDPDACTEEVLEKFGLLEDCVPFDNVWAHALSAVHGSIRGVDALVEDHLKVCFHLYGGRHHSLSTEARGLCYLNDVVLSVLHLQERGVDKVVVVDLDIHHGDGTQEAFEGSSSVHTLSMHLHEPGFYPGKWDCILRILVFYCLSWFSVTILLLGTGAHDGVHNIGLNRTCTDKQFVDKFESAFHQHLHPFNAKVCVLVLGADALRGDPRGGLGLSEQPLLACLKTLVDHYTQVLGKT